MRNKLKRFAPILLVNLLAFLCGYVFFQDRTEQAQPKKIAVVTIKPGIGTESPYIQGIKMRGMTRAELHKRIGKPLAVEANNDEPTDTDYCELLDNAFTRVTFFGGTNTDPVFTANEKVVSVDFDFDGITARYKTRLCLIVEYKGKNYLLDEATTPKLLQASFPDAKEARSWYASDPKYQVFQICDESIMVSFTDSKITNVSLFGVEPRQ